MTKAYQITTGNIKETLLSVGIVILSRLSALWLDVGVTK